MSGFSLTGYIPEEHGDNLPEEQFSIQNAVAIALLVNINLIFAATSNSIKR